MSSQRSAVRVFSAGPPASETLVSHEQISNSPGGTWKLSASGFSLGILIVSLFFQRFGLPAGGALKISFATPLGFLLVIWGFASGTLALDRRRVALLIALGAVAFISFNCQVNLPVMMTPRRSLVSGLYWFAVTSFAVLRFAEPLDENRFFRLVNGVLCIIGVAGLLQFVAQFTGVSVFAFSGILPDSILMEEQFHVAAPLDFGLMRSNGFFLVEPSAFSQFMATGIIIEILYFKRTWYLALFFASILASASGTGWLVLGSFVLGAVFTYGRSGPLLAFVTASIIAGFLGVLSLVAPNITDMLWDRTYEFSLPGTSGYERFVTPFMLLNDVVHDSPRTVITGIGPGASEGVLVSYIYGVNIPVKIMLEYGIFGLISYLTLFLTATRTPRQTALVFPMMVLLLFTGGNQLFSPVLFPILLFITVAVLQVAGQTVKVPAIESPVT